MTDDRNQECIFCAIIAGDEPASFVYRDDRVVAFMTTGPVTPGHLMVLPIVHAELLGDMDEETGTHLFGVAMRLQAALRASSLSCEGINIFLADGEAAFQEVPHVHLHVFPRFDGDTFRIDADWSVRPTREELDANAEMVRQALR